MITTFGKKAITKYLADTIVSPFQYMALGSGPLPGSATPADADNLVFETVRVPILETSAYQENGNNYLSFTCTVPTELRYEFSEIGVYPAQENNAIASPNSTAIFVFSSTEGWETRSGTGVDTELVSATTIDDGYGELDATYEDDDLIFTSSADPYFLYDGRFFQSSRYGNEAMLLSGGLSSLVGSPGSFNEASMSSDTRARLDHSIDLSGARHDDEIALAFVVLNKNLSEFSSNPPETVRIAVEFKEFATSTDYARLEILVDEADAGVDLSANPYIVSSASIGASSGNSQFVKTEGFSWQNVGIVNIYVHVTPTNDTSTIDSATDIDVATDTFTTYGNHGLSNGDTVSFTGITTAANVIDSTRYWVTVIDDTSFQISATSGGDVIDIGGSNDSGITVSGGDHDKYFVLLDGLRFISKNNTNPNYGLLAYSIANPDDGSTIVKSAGHNRRFTYTMKVDVG